MKIYPKKIKSDRQSENFYFGNYGEIPVGISFATINNNGNNNGDKLHCHKKGFEFYLTVQGSGFIEVEGREIGLNKEQIIMVEPGEKHKIKLAKKTPFSFIVFNTLKDEKDRIAFE